MNLGTHQKATDNKKHIMWFVGSVSVCVFMFLSGWYFFVVVVCLFVCCSVLCCCCCCLFCLLLLLLLFVVVVCKSGIQGFRIKKQSRAEYQAEGNLKTQDHVNAIICFGFTY